MLYLFTLSKPKIGFPLYYKLHGSVYLITSVNSPTINFHFSPLSKLEGNTKESSNYCTTALISHAGKVILKILQARLQQYVNRELPDVHAGFRKGRGTRDQIANIHWLIEKARELQKTSISALLTTSKPLTMWITANCGKFFKRWEYQTT